MPEMEDRARKSSRLLMERYYSDLVSEENRDKKVVYLFTSGGISELFRSFDFRIVLPEINAIRCARTGIAPEMIRQGEVLGFIDEMCSYVKSDFGLMFGPSHGEAPFGKIPRPDLIVINNSGCSTYIKWAEAQAREFGCPVGIIDVPFSGEDFQVEMDHLYIKGQIEELIPLCENISGVTFDLDRLKGILRLTKEAIDLWLKLLEFGKLRPSPFDSYFEGASYMAPLTIWRGTIEAVKYYRDAIEQMEERASAGYSPSGTEKFRLLFEGSPPWPNFNEFWEMFRKRGAAAVACSYVRVVCACEELRWGPDKPMDFLADLAAQSFYNWNHEKKLKFLERLARDYEVDGFVAHSVRSCRPMSIGQLDLRSYFAREAGIPALFLDSDIADPRYFSSYQMLNRIDTFFEALEAKMKRAGSGVEA
jgi:benzoyl-CoA reductase subunit B